MAPTAATSADSMSELLSKRYYCYGNNCGNGWYWYGRWIFAAVVIILILAIFFIWACVNSRRRRRRGVAPMYGTGWMANGGQYQNNPNGYSGYNGYNNAPPAYGAPQGQVYPMDQYTGNTFNQRDGYYGQHEGIQQPKETHQPANHQNDYAPPAGPPPGKTH